MCVMRRGKKSKVSFSLVLSDDILMALMCF